MKYRKKPVVIEAIKWDGENSKEVLDLARRSIGKICISIFTTVTISTLEGHMKAELGDWIIKGVKGELYPCKDEIFRATYEEVLDVV